MTRNIREAIDIAKMRVGTRIWELMNRAHRRALVYGPGCRKRSRTTRLLTNRRISHGNA